MRGGGPVLLLMFLASTLGSLIGVFAYPAVTESFLPQLEVFLSRVSGLEDHATTAITARVLIAGCGSCSGGAVGLGFVIITHACFRRKNRKVK
jgi:hypothetical protein